MFSSYREQLNTLWNGLHSNQHKWTIVLFLFILVISGIFGGSFLAGQRFPGLPLVNWESNLATTVRTTQHVSASQDALPAESPVPSQRAIELQKLQLQYAQARKTSLQSAWEAYKETHTSALREHKLFLYVPHQSGQGNKLPGIATAFMLALISHRALLIDYCKCVQDTQGECKCQWGDFFEQEELELDIVSLLARNPGLNGVIREKSLAQVDFVHDAVSLNLADLADRPVVWGNGSKDWTGECPLDCIDRSLLQLEVLRSGCAKFDEPDESHQKNKGARVGSPDLMSFFELSRILCKSPSLCKAMACHVVDRGFKSCLSQVAFALSNELELYLTTA